MHIPEDLRQNKKAQQYTQLQSSLVSNKSPPADSELSCTYCG